MKPPCPVYPDEGGLKIAYGVKQNGFSGLLGGAVTADAGVWHPDGMHPR
jgi:hypothetical protein